MQFRILILLLLFFSNCNQNESVSGSYQYIEPVSGVSKNKMQKKIETEVENMKDILEISGERGIYSTLIFKGKNTVVIKSFQLEFATSYEMDGDYIKIKTESTDLLFKVKDNNTLIGEGFASGVYKKVTSE